MFCLTNIIGKRKSVSHISYIFTYPRLNSNLWIDIMFYVDLVKYFLKKCMYICFSEPPEVVNLLEYCWPFRYWFIFFFLNLGSNKWVPRSERTSCSGSWRINWSNKWKSTEGVCYPYYRVSSKPNLLIINLLILIINLDNLNILFQ